MNNYIKSEFDWEKLHGNLIKNEKIGKGRPRYLIMSNDTLSAMRMNCNPIAFIEELAVDYDTVLGVPIAICGMLEFGKIDIIY